MYYTDKEEEEEDLFGEHLNEDDDEDQEVVLPILMDETVLFKFDEKLKIFDFDSEKDKALDIVNKRIDENEFEDDLNKLKDLCFSVTPSGAFRAWMLFCSIALLIAISMFFLIIWIVLILDLVILAGEIYVLKKFKKIVWNWKNNKVDKDWVLEIERILNGFNETYKLRGLEWRFESEGKWIQLRSVSPIR